MPTLTLELSDDVLDALAKTGSVRLSLVAPEGSKGRPRAEEPRAGSLPARVLAWAEKRGRPFGTADVERRFKLSRAHASMVLSKLANGPYGVRRERRGVYVHARAGEARTRGRLRQVAKKK